jgi:hypothetical protein
MGPSKQRGNVLVILLLALALLVASAYWYRSKKTAAKAEAARIEEVAKQEAVAKAQSELKALQQQIDASKTKNVLEISIKSATDIYAKWKDGIEVAQRTSRVGLATPVATLQALRREAENLIVPDCLKTGKANLLEAMKLEIDGFLAFMGDTTMGKYVAQANSDAAAKLLVGFEADISMCPKQ